MKRVRSLASYALLATGAVLLFQGARFIIEARFGQEQAAREFETARHAPGEETRNAKPGDTIARMAIPRLHMDLYVVEGDDSEDLRRGPGHMSGTAMPGATGNCVIAGHRDTHFRALKDVRRGDDIIIQTKAGQFLYRVERTNIVPPTDTRSLQPTRASELNLITCYPFYYVGSAPERFVVQAQLAGSVAVDSSQSGSAGGA